MILRLAAGTALALALAVPAQAADEQPCQRELVVLGAGQDAGAPQIGHAGDEGPVLSPSSLGLIDRRAGKRYLLDATPDITSQLIELDTIYPPMSGQLVDGIFLTHAHIGHYLGLAWLGREAAGAKNVPVYAMPRMEAFLRENGPWSQLVELGNITFPLGNSDSSPLAGGPNWPLDVVGGKGKAIGRVAFLPGGLSAVSIPVAHRDEFSETVGWVFIARDNALDENARSFLYLPDIDRWDAEPPADEDSAIVGLVQKVDLIFVDATFWDDNELLDENGVGRDMSEIPHPRVTQTMDLLQHLPVEERAKVHFIHYNHTNPIRDPDSAESRQVIERGFNIARRGDRICLD